MDRERAGRGREKWRETDREREVEIWGEGESWGERSVEGDEHSSARRWRSYA